MGTWSCYCVRSNFCTFIKYDRNFSACRGDGRWNAHDKRVLQTIVDGIFVEMKDLGMWQGEVITPKDPLIFTDGEVHYLNAGYAGIFLPTVEHWTNVKKGDKIGEILDPLESVVKEELYSECDGILFTLREYPVVSEGSLIGRILERQA